MWSVEKGKHYASKHTLKIARTRPAGAEGGLGVHLALWTECPSPVARR